MYPTVLGHEVTYDGLMARSRIETPTQVYVDSMSENHVKQSWYKCCQEPLRKMSIDQLSCTDQMLIKYAWHVSAFHWNHKANSVSQWHAIVKQWRYEKTNPKKSI